MPLNTLRLNYQASSHPNERIVFIKPIPRPPAQQDDYSRAETVLKAIAAQCMPIMKDHYLSVTTLEEYEPNPEFIGRNFNNGEIIQLVIKSKSGAWLPLDMIQMVMMHELAHNTHMNHGKGFWQTRNLYANEMHGLWSKGYTGEGLWGQGRSLESMDQDLGGRVLRSDELKDLPLCGGTFRSRQRKRKAKGPDLTWKEKRDKRIEKKFGKSGEKLGEDEDARMTLELKGIGPIGGKPRVAQSKRGRELRAAAALARFETNKKGVKEPEGKIPKDEDETETESEYEDIDATQEDARDPFGRKILDKMGKSMIRICEEEDEDDLDVKKEMQELASLGSIQSFQGSSHGLSASIEPENPSHVGAVNGEQDESSDEESQKSPEPMLQNKDSVSLQEGPEAKTNSQSRKDEVVTTPLISDQSTRSDSRIDDLDIQCQICSMLNNPLRLNCETCAHVLDIRKDPNHWKCKSEICKDSAYINAGDCGICGVCGTRKPVAIAERPERRGGGAGSSNYSPHIAYI